MIFIINIPIWYICKDILFKDMEKHDIQTEYRRFCAVLRKVRRDKKINQVDLAGRIGKPQSFISKVELGERRLDYIELKCICKAIGITISEFEKAYNNYRDS
jgi:ribosome-binding protein aMBF1 (putative translation factor)